MSVSAAPPLYAASMSSTIGIGLSPVAVPPRGVKVRYHWTADHGRFLDWSEVTHQITNRGAETMTEKGGRLFWSYDPADEFAVERKPVRIVILGENAADGKVLVRNDVHLVWDDGFIHVVR